jgi:hypothetical protein
MAQIKVTQNTIPQLKYFKQAQKCYCSERQGKLEFKQNQRRKMCQ